MVRPNRYSSRSRASGTTIVVALIAALLLAACGSTVAPRARTEAASAGNGLDAGSTPIAVDSSSDAATGTTLVSDAGGARATAPKATAAGTAGSSTARAGGLAATGPGWDKSFIYVGVTTQKDVQTAFSGVGVNAIDAGDQEGQANAIVDDLNRRGGLFGRKLKLVFKDQSTVATAQDPNGAGAAACTHFTQDHRVVALINPVTLMDVPSFRGCMAKAKVPLFSASVAGVDAKVGADLAPFFYQTVSPTWNALAPGLVAELQAQGWFNGWNARTGSPSPTRAKVGILAPTDDISGRILAVVQKVLATAGYADATTYQYANPTDMSPAVLSFNGRGVTHVIAINSDLLSFMITANAQGYRPRYGVSSINAPASLLQGNAPRPQLIGALGAGWSPSIDVSDANDPGPTTAGETECTQLLARGGQQFGGKRLAEAVAFAFCDSMRLLVQAANAGGGLSGAELYTGVQRVGAGFTSALSFGSGLGVNRLFIPGAVRPLAWVTNCECFRYTTRTNRGL